MGTPVCSSGGSIRTFFKSLGDFHEQKNYLEGIVSMPFKEGKFKPILIENLSKLDGDGIEDQLAKHDPDSYRSAIVFVDGLSSNVELMVESLFNVFGLDLHYVGGGAGSLSFEKQPCVVSNEGLKEDAALIVLTDLELGIGVSHGWQSVSDPLKITESDKNRVISIDYKPAYEVYKSIVEPLADTHFTNGNFFTISKGFPFGFADFRARSRGPRSHRC